FALPHPSRLEIAHVHLRGARNPGAVGENLFGHGTSMPVATRSCTRWWNGGLDLFATPAVVRLAGDARRQSVAARHDEHEAATRHRHRSLEHRPVADPFAALVRRYHPRRDGPAARRIPRKR